MSAARHAGYGLLAVLVLIVVLLAFFAWRVRHVATLPPQPATSVAVSRLLTQPIADDVPDAEHVRRGQYLVREGDCLSCHLAAGGKPFAGGLGLNTPFGVIYSSNITSDRNAGIGAWTSDQFYRAMHDGIGIHGERLYPAFPYPWFERASRADDDAILAYLKTVPPVDSTPPPNRLPFPFNIRKTVAAWDLLFLHQKAFTPDPQQSAEWNRGAQIVNGLGHCGGCHTPKNTLGADKSSEMFWGADLDNHVAPDLTSNAHTGLGTWSVDEIVEYLKTGRNARANAGGPMADVITYSTSLLNDDDRHAIAVYLKSLPASDDESAKTPDPGAMKRGAEIYTDACSACHLGNGVGQPGFFPPLGRNSVVQQRDPTGLLHILLAGSRTAPSPTRPSPLAMPSFAWKLSDAEIADVSTYLRNSWGNRANDVSTKDVRDLREKLDLTTVHLTANSGDHDQAPVPTGNLNR